MTHEERLHLAIEFERAVRFLAKRMPVSNETSRKPVLFHNIRVGVSLYEKGYAPDIVIAGILHDAIEFAGVSEEELIAEFGDEIARLVHANTKDDTIANKHKKTHELISRCVANGESALIIKTADILDSFRWYSRMENPGELDYCHRNATAILEMKPDTFQDPIFEELRGWNDKVK
jgi:GTP pyrophosphokinase